MNDTVFATDAVMNRSPDVRARGADGKFGDGSFMIPPARPQLYGMGQALHGTTLDYLKFLRLVLNDGVVNGRRILSSNAMALLKQNQIGSMRIPFPVKSTVPEISADLDLFPGKGIPCTHTAGFVRNEVDVPGARRAGSLTWGGILNTLHWVDPTSGIAAVLFSQHIPFIEPRFLRVYETFEKTIYSELGKA
jgi:CubicO group peptidase (beta-lactamase class C family)